MQKKLPLLLWGLLLVTVNAVLLTTAASPTSPLSWVWTTGPADAASQTSAVTPPASKPQAGTGPRIKVKEPTLALGEDEQTKEKPRNVEKVVVTAGVNMRSGPASSHGVIKTLPTGMELEVVSRANGWTEVANTQSGERGWVYDNFIKPVGMGSSVEARTDRVR